MNCEGSDFLACRPDLASLLSHSIDPAYMRLRKLVLVRKSEYFHCLPPLGIWAAASSFTSYRTRHVRRALWLNGKTSSQSVGVLRGIVVPDAERRNAACVIDENVPAPKGGLLSAVAIHVLWLACHGLQSRQLLPISVVPSQT